MNDRPWLTPARITGYTPDGKGNVWARLVTADGTVVLTQLSCELLREMAEAEGTASREVTS